jgi:3-oxoadipate enol-lactonase
MDFRASNPRITVPTLVIVGAQDPATPPAVGEAIHQAIKGSQLVSIDASHIANVEQPKAYTEALSRFFA